MNRYENLVTWATTVLPRAPKQISLLSGDASFRKYYRAHNDDGSTILVDADPTHENTPEFVKIATSLKATGIIAPVVHAVDYNNGFMILSDMGDDLLLPHLNPRSVQRLYSLAIDELIAMQQCQCDVRDYSDKLLLQEMSLFHEWFLQKELTSAERQLLDATYETLIESALSQPKVFVHLDYHSRNLMLIPSNRLGVLDFQDAAVGPITYDLVSLLRDCYIDWPEEVIDDFIEQYLEKTDLDVEPERFRRWFDWMGMQRHLKCVGIFTRLNLRDNKPGYLKDIPRVMNYLITVSAKYPEFSEFNQFLTHNWE